MSSSTTAISLERIVAGFKGDTLENVTVIFVARDPFLGGQKIIGWYKNAILHRHRQPLPKTVALDFSKVLKQTRIPHDVFDDYSASVNCEDAVLLPTDDRTQPIPGGVKKGSFGQSNVYYPLDGHGNPKRVQWLADAVHFVSVYDKENLLKRPYSEKGLEQVETNLERAAGYQSNPAIRRAIEEWAMKAAKRWLRENGFADLVDTHKYKCYDYECTKNAVRYFVEVKGTQTKGTSVALTRNEVDHAQDNGAVSLLFVLHSVRVKGIKAVSADGGVVRLLSPWDIKEGSLEASAYIYKLP